MAFGGYSPYPRRFGGGKPRLKTIHEGLNAQRGTAYSKDRTSIVWVENMAIARAISASWSTNQRLANQADARRMTDMLPRWERIFAIPVPSGATESERRSTVGEHFAAIGEASIHGKMFVDLQRELGNFFVAIEYISLANAVVHVPAATPSYPFGTVAAGFPWYSTVAHILILMQKPAGATEAEFYEKAGLVHQILDPIIPIWATFDWYRASDCGVPTNVVGGPSQGGFYLDCEHNLDNQVFDV